MCGSLLENGRFGGRRGRGVGWGLAGWPSEPKNVGTKRSYTPPLGGKKTQAFLVAPQKGSFVGWLVIWEGERGIEERVERSASARLSVMLVSHFHSICGVPTRPRSSMGRALKFFKSHVENFGAPKIEQAGM